MRSVMHHSAYQQLEASWRGVHWLLRRLDTDRRIELHLLDISKEELLADLQQADTELEQAQIFHRLVTSQAAADSAPYQLLPGDFLLAQTEDDLGLLIDMATMAEAAGSTFLCAASSAVAGFPCLASSIVHNEPEPPEPGFAEAWAAIRDYSASRHVLLTSPRFMLRQPYGSTTATTDCFAFEEMGEERDHRHYLWGNGAYLAAVLIGQHFLGGGTDFSGLTDNVVGDLELHHFGTDHRHHSAPCATGVKLCAETLLTDAAAQQFRANGLCVVRSVHNQDQVIIPWLNSLHVSGELATPWVSVTA